MRCRSPMPPCARSMRLAHSAANASCFLSPLRRGGRLGQSSLLYLLRQAGLTGRTTVHGFRTSFRSWAGECTYADHAVMELCLAHTVGSAVERAYARSDLTDKRRALMTAWAETVAAS